MKSKADPEVAYIPFIDMETGKPEAKEIKPSDHFFGIAMKGGIWFATEKYCKKFMREDSKIFKQLRKEEKELLKLKKK